jgi:WD40 repeat protein
MSLQYNLAWDTRNTALALRNLRWAEFSPDGKWLASGNDKYIHIISARDGLVKSRVGFDDPPASITWFPKSASVLICGYQNGTIANLTFLPVRIPNFVSNTKITYVSLHSSLVERGLRCMRQATKPPDNTRVDR